tara:strand:+ start:1849 stop:3654 length:1806 start_codon:yes stop_codon:yes gene_type:complete
MSILEKLTEGIVNRDMQKEGAALLSKWEKTGLLEGLESDQLRGGMARLLENQAKELLRESSTMAAGDVEGFSAVAFPLVRRVFGSLIANELVSVQPMSLPSGLIFFLDFVVSPDVAGDTSVTTRLGYEVNESIYGGNAVARQLTGGVNLTGDAAEDGPYALNNGFSSATGSTGTIQIEAGSGAHTSATSDIIIAGTFGANNEDLDRVCRFDPDLTSGSSVVAVIKLAKTQLTGNNGTLPNLDNLPAISLRDSTRGISGSLVRRLTQYSGSAAGGLLRDHVLFVVQAKSGVALKTLTGSICASHQGRGGDDAANAASTFRFSFPEQDNLTNGGAIGSIKGQTEWALEAEAKIPEIDIKIDSVAVTAVTKKLKAKWSPELGQDLNAYHNLDAEVELTSILSEQIALEIDREILADLVNGQTAGIRYWSRAAGRFVNRLTGLEIGPSTATPDFTGNVSEWYETLIETINDVSAQIHRKTLRGGANFIVCGPEVANVLEFTAGFRANVTVDSDRGDVGTVRVGNLSKKFDVFVDPYFPRSVILVGRRGGSFLESGYVYAPYVPLQTTPTIFGVEDFVPRKGVMTRYAKQMVRPDMYGLVIVADLV